MELNIKTDMDQCLKFFNGLDVNKKAIKRKLLGSVGAGARKAVRRNYLTYLGKRSGTLYRSIYYKVRSDSRGVFISNNASSGANTAKDGRDARYGFMLAQGYTVEAKDKLLTFQVDGKWVRKHSVTVSPRDWVAPPVERYVSSPACHTDLDKAFQKQVDYWEKRITGGNL